MSVPDEYSEFCRCGCGVYNVRGYDEGCLSKFINFIIKKGVSEVTEATFEELWDEFIEGKKNE